MSGGRGQIRGEAEKEGRPGRQGRQAGKVGRRDQAREERITAYGIRHTYGIQHTAYSSSSSVAGRTCPHLCVCALPEGWERKEGRGEGS